jgi:hypothetical protein
MVRKLLFKLEIDFSFAIGVRLKYFSLSCLSKAYLFRNNYFMKTANALFIVIMFPGACSAPKKTTPKD